MGIGGEMQTSIIAFDVLAGVDLGKIRLVDSFFWCFRLVHESDHGVIPARLFPMRTRDCSEHARIHDFTTAKRYWCKIRLLDGRKHQVRLLGE